MKRHGLCALAGTLLLMPTAFAQVVDFRCASWEPTPNAPLHAYAVIRWSESWTHAQATNFASSVQARLASLPTASCLSNAVSLCSEEAFWRCAGPWIGPARAPSQSWRWHDGTPVQPDAWSPGRPGQSADLPACLLLDGELGPNTSLTDALDAEFGQPETSSALLEWTDPRDCDLDQIPDPLEIAMDPTLDEDGDGRIDGCEGVSPDIDGDGQVDFGDVALVLLDFGPCAGCPADQDLNGIVDFGDVALVLLSFGS